jgi:hypothetical protein
VVCRHSKAARAYAHHSPHHPCVRAYTLKAPVEPHDHTHTPTYARPLPMAPAASPRRPPGWYGDAVRSSEAVCVCACACVCVCVCACVCVCV